MKTPWKFLVELTSRRRSAKGQENSIGHDTDPAAQAHEAEQTQAPHSTEISTSGDHDQAVPVDRVTAASDEDSLEASQVSARPAGGEEAGKAEPSESRHSDLGAGVPAEITVKSLRKPRPGRPERTQGTRAAVVARSPVAPHEGQGVQRPSSPNAFFDEVASLDEDIKKLRSELARKLQRQNAQLKTMLKRFDVS